MPSAGDLEAASLALGVRATGRDWGPWGARWGWSGAPGLVVCVPGPPPSLFGPVSGNSGWHSTGAPSGWCGALSAPSHFGLDLLCSSLSWGCMLWGCMLHAFSISSGQGWQAGSGHGVLCPPQHPQGIWGTRAPKWAQWCAQIPCACCNLHVDHCCPPAVPFHPPLCGAFLASPPTGSLNVLPPSTPLSSPS